MSDATPDKLSGFIIQQSKKTVINFEDFDAVNWNRLYILTPYVHKGQFDDNLKTYENVVRETGIEDSDNETVLVLYDDDKLVSKSKIPRTIIDFAHTGKLVTGKIGYYTKAEAIFRIESYYNRRVASTIMVR